MAIRDIEPGEEICISYIDLDKCCDDTEMDEEYEEWEDEDGQITDNQQTSDKSVIMSFSERQEMLKNFYLFECDCVVCQEDAQQEAVGK